MLPRWYDPSFYFPGTGSHRLTVADFRVEVEKLTGKADADSVYEVLSLLREQLEYRIRFRLVDYRIGGLFLGLIFLAYPYLGTSQDWWVRITIVFMVLLYSAFNIFRRYKSDKGQRRQLMDVAGDAIKRIALNPNYIHEPFAEADCFFFRKFFAGKSIQDERALSILIAY